MTTHLDDCIGSIPLLGKLIMFDRTTYPKNYHRLQKRYYKEIQGILLGGLTKEQKKFLQTLWKYEADPYGSYDAGELPLIEYMIKKACYDGRATSQVTISLGITEKRREAFGKKHEKIRTVFEAIGLAWRNKGIADLRYGENQVVFSIELKL